MKRTYQVAYSIGMDAADRRMRAARRSAWNEEDTAIAAVTLYMHFPLCAELPGIEPEICGCSLCKAQITELRKNTDG